MLENNNYDKGLFCSFCAKEQSAVKKLIAGPAVHICDECVRLCDKILEEEKIVDLVVGPDAYRDLPNLLEEIEDGRQAINVILSIY